MIYTHSDNGRVKLALVDKGSSIQDKVMDGSKGRGFKGPKLTYILCYN